MITVSAYLQPYGNVYILPIQFRLIIKTIESDYVFISSFTNVFSCSNFFALPLHWIFLAEEIMNSFFIVRMNKDIPLPTNIRIQSNNKIIALDRDSKKNHGRVLSRRSAQFIHDFLPARFKYASVVARVELCRKIYFVS